MPRLKLSKENDPVLRKKNADLKFPLTPEMRDLIDKMIFSCKKFKGVGLAAPQVGLNLNLAIINLSQYGISAFPIINPAILSCSKETEVLEEGCLSIPERFAEVKRPSKIKVSFFNQNGKNVNLDAEGFLAVVLQHEIDHLNGILICDKWNKQTMHLIKKHGG